MAIFTDIEAPRPRDGRRGRRVGWTILVLAIVGLVAFGFTPAPYAIEEPGPVYNTIGSTSVGGHSVAVISIPSRKSLPTSGALDMLTVNITGDPDDPPNWTDVAAAWFDPSQAVVPMDEIYAPHESVKQSNAEGSAEMSESQQDATAAALREQGIRFTTTLSIDSTIKASPASGLLRKGDILETVNGRPAGDATQLHNLIVTSGTTKPITIVFSRGKVVKTIQVTPALSPGSDPAPYIGVYLDQKYGFPFDVKIQLQDVGGPSAGQMFALGIIDKLTDGQLTGGRHIAGTGTITASGVVGAIGGIRQKLYGARNAGAEYFLAPKSNCDEVIGHVPSGIRVFATSTLTQSVAEVKAIAAGTGLSSLPTCGGN